MQYRVDLEALREHVQPRFSVHSSGVLVPYFEILLARYR